MSLECPISKMPCCAVCGLPVYGMERRDLPGMRALEFTVHCHGESETTVIGFEDLVECQGEIQPGIAFARKVLT